METGLQFEAVTSQSRYAKGRDVVVRVFLFNFGEDPITVNSRLALNAFGLPGEVSFHLAGPSGRPVPFVAKVNVGEPHAEDFSTIAPWHCVGRQYELDSYFRITRPGQYRLTATYRNETPEGGARWKAWTGTLRSNTIEFAVGRKGTE